RHAWRHNAKIFDMSGKSAAQIHHCAIRKTPTGLNSHNSSLNLSCARSRQPLNFAKIGSMGWSAADGIANAGVDRQVEVRAVRIERIAIANSQLIATLPPAMFAHDDARIELFTEAH